MGESVLARARERIASGALSAAHELLTEALTTMPPDPMAAGPYVAEAVVLQTGVLLGLNEPYAARGWAAYGFTAHRGLYGDRDRRTLHALGLLAAVLTRVGRHTRAAQRYQDLISAYAELEGPDSDRVLAAKADLATVEHAVGDCLSARLRLANVIAEYQRRHGKVHPVAIRMQARLAAMWRDCGRFDDAHELLSEARRYAALLGADDPVHALLATAAGAEADLKHACGGELVPPPVPRPDDGWSAPQDDPLLPDAPLVDAQPVGAHVNHAWTPRQPEYATTAPAREPLPHERAWAAETAWSTPDAGAARWDHLTPAHDGPDAPSAPGFTTAYLPPYLATPDFATPHFFAPEQEAPRWAQPPAPERAQQRQNLVLIAACVGIVAVTLLFVLLVSSVSPH
ncbi:tetratricopeptide repeat protein [Catellatospora sp. KI3]|uniref:tetratricopeptide repeat protein n=1 Tax=Catellatospora sp. KI3 TaxID=3041620 RepID=UPI00248216B2|nr:tetratricopeptide repeat protein [Catellatospora sp. KI3]MDI1465650.1 tetratricopeptide repeat protein [Catellatospora sp. KI3]